MSLGVPPKARDHPSGQPVLLIEDTVSLQMVYKSVLAQAGHSVRTASSAAEGLAAFKQGQARVVLLDLVLPDRNGLDLMQEMLTLRPDTNVIVMTAHGSINKAVEAMQAGAYEFLVKPFDEQRFLMAVANAIGNQTARRIVQKAGSLIAAPKGGEVQSNAFVGSSEVMRNIHTKITSVARSMATVFITGESGTGKELCALAVHGTSPRAAGPFIALNCGAIPHELLESEVFGHMKGSFTGAISDKPGAAMAADGGTLFLDEVCEMAPALQTKLLRFLQTSTVVPVGATRPRKVNVRIVCATNRDPLDAVRRGLFREDLFYRLFVVPIHMPPLRDRAQDVIEIAEAALARFGDEEGKAFAGLAPAVQTLFRQLPWPGNVRQVLNVIRNVVVLNEDGLVTLDMLPSSLIQQLAQPSAFEPALAQTKTDQPELEGLIGRSLVAIERIVIEATLARHGGSVPKAARVLQLSPSTLYRKLESWSKA